MSGVGNPIIAPVKSSSSLKMVTIITEKPKVTIARNQAFNLTHVRPIRKPIAAESKLLNKSANIGGIPNLIAINAETKPPTPKKAACPKEPCPEEANKFQLEA